MGKVIRNTSMLREPNGKRPMRLKHRFEDGKYFDVLRKNGPMSVSGIVHTVNGDRTDYTSVETTLEGAELGRWQTNRGIIPLPGEGPNRKTNHHKPKPEASSVTVSDNLPKIDNNVIEIAEMISKISKIGGTDPRVDGLVEKLEELRNRVETMSKPTIVEVSKDGRQPRRVEGNVHKRFADALKLASIPGAGLYLWGPAGTGKTSAAAQIAKALDLKFYFSSRLLEHYSLAGFRTANGETVRTEFREAFEHGGVFLLDEMDRSDPNAVLWLNAALANGVCAFPDATIKQHPDFIIIATGNTKLNGASSDYNGAMKQDASVADRFRFLKWGIDEALEESVYYAMGAQSSAWLERVRRIRAVVDRRQIQGFDVTPRAVFDGLALILKGLSEDLALEASVERNCECSAWESIISEAA